MLWMVKAVRRPALAPKPLSFSAAHAPLAPQGAALRRALRGRLAGRTDLAQTATACATAGCGAMPGGARYGGAMVGGQVASHSRSARRLAVAAVTREENEHPPTDPSTILRPKARSA